jgi:ribosomal protein S18 acetylase RimI-like enzyme
MDVTLRAAVPDDDTFLRHLHATAHCAAFSSLALEPEAHAALLGLQFDSRRAQYRARYPGAVDEIVVVDGERVGRCWTSETHRELRLMDLAVLPERQRRGVAGSVLDRLLERARAARLAVRLSVWSENAPALALYRGHGFSETISDADAAPGLTDAGYRELEWSPTPARTS